MILKKVYKGFLHCKNVINLAHKPHLTHMFLLAMETEFRRGLYLHDADYDTDANHDLPQLLKRTTQIYAVTAVAKTFLDPMGPHGSGMHTLMSTPKGRPAKPLLQWMMHRHLSFGDAPPPVIGSISQQDLHKELEHIRRASQVCSFPPQALNSLQHKFNCKHNIHNGQNSTDNLPKNSNSGTNCCHMLMSALPMTQFWSMGSLTHQYSCSPAAAFTLVRLANETALVSSSRLSTI